MGNYMCTKKYWKIIKAIENMRMKSDDVLCTNVNRI